MKLRRFIAKRLHGHLNIDVTFNEDLTLLTGINGTGKTSVVRAVVGLLLPSFRYLAETKYDHLRVYFEDNNDETFVESFKKDEKIHIRRKKQKGSLDFSVPEWSELQRIRGSHDQYLELVDQMQLRYSDAPVIEFIQSKPTPMFLGLERSSGEGDLTDPLVRDRYIGRRPSIPLTLRAGVREARRLAEEGFRDFQSKHSVIAQSLRKRILLSCFDIDKDNENPFNVKLPKKTFEKEMIEKRRLVDSALSNIGLSDRKTRSMVDSFFESLLGVSRQLGLTDSFSDLLEDEDSAAPLLRWMTLQPNLQQINRITRYVQEYNTRRARLYAPVDKYLSSVNQFFSDSGKELKYDERGRLSSNTGRIRMSPLAIYHLWGEPYICHAHACLLQPKNNCKYFNHR